jgi:YVTN family beta-propeller protein
VDPASDKVVADLPVGKGGTLGTTTPDGKKIYVGAAAEGQDTVTVIDLDKKAVVASIKTGNRPKHPQVSPDGKMVLVNHWGLDDGKLRVSFIDTATDKVVKEIPLEVSNANPSGPTSMHNGWSTDSRWAFTVDRVDNQFVIIDTNDWTVKSIDLPSKPHYTAPSPDGKEVWVVVEGVDRNNPPMAIVYAINGGAFKEIARLAMPLEGQTAIEGHHGNFTQDGKYFMLLNRGGGKNKTGNEVAVFDASTKKLVAALHTGSTGIGHAYNTPDGKYAVITNYGNNVISIVDTGSWKVVKDITIGKGRMGHIAFTKDGKWGYVSNNQDGVLYKVDMTKLELVGPVKTNGTKGAGQVLNVYTPVFEELPR